MYEGVITILNKHSLPFFSSFYLSEVVVVIEGKNKNRRQRSFHSLTKIIKRKGGWPPVKRIGVFKRFSVIGIAFLNKIVIVLILSENCGFFNLCLTEQI